MKESMIDFSKAMSVAEIADVFEALGLGNDEARRAARLELTEPRRAHEVQITLGNNTGPQFPPTQCPPSTTS
jgi:hypothetical protein